MCTSTDNNNMNSAAGLSSSVFSTSLNDKHNITASRRPNNSSSSSFHLYDKPKILTPKRCERIVKYARKRLRGNNESNDDNDDHESSTTILTHSQIELGKLLGKGAFSSVYEIKSIESDTRGNEPEETGVESQTTTQIVVKFLRTKLYDNHGLFAASASDLVKEGMILAQLNHVNVIRLHAVSSLEGVECYRNGYHDSYFLVLERLECTLSNKIEDWQTRHRHLYESYTQATALVGQQQQQQTEEEDVPSWRKRITTLTNKSMNNNKNRVLISSKDTAVSPSLTSTSPSSDDDIDVYDRSDAYYTSTDDISKLIHNDTDDDDDFSKDDSIIYNGINSSTTTTKKKKKTSSSVKRMVSSIRDLVEERIDVAIQLGDAIAYLHSQNVCHRDLKPDNIGFDSNGILKVFDFDIARVAPPPSGMDPDETFRMTGKVGSPRYMSPECANKEDYNLKTDVYTYGLLFHQMMTLEKPYDDLADEEHDECVFYHHVRPCIPSLLPTSTKQVLFRSWAPTIAFRPTMRRLCQQLKYDRDAIVEAGTPPTVLPSQVLSSMSYVSSCTFASLSDCNVAVVIKKKKKTKKINNKKNKGGGMSSMIPSGFRQLLLGGERKKQHEGKLNIVPMPKIQPPTYHRQKSSNAMAA